MLASNEQPSAVIPPLEAIRSDNYSPPLEINAPAILLLGKTGAGKSTLGNLLMATTEEEEPTFIVSDSFESVTTSSRSAHLELHGQLYNLVDTPGLFDTSKLNEDIMDEIAHTIKKCAFGIKAILFVFEAKRFTEEQKNLLNGIKTFLGEASLQYMIAVFSHCNKRQTQDTGKLRSSWNGPVRAFVNSIGNRWAISPNPELFPPDDSVHQQRLSELRDTIVKLDGEYTNDLLEEARKRKDEIARSEREREKERQREYDEIKRREGEAKAMENYLEQKTRHDAERDRAREDEIRSLREFMERKIAELEQKDKELNDKTNELADINTNLNDTINELDSNKDDLMKLIGELTLENKQLQENIKKPSEPNQQQCFWLETSVKLESGRIIPMSELQVGDRVLSNVKNGITEFSDIYLIAHIGKLDHEAKFTKVRFTRPDGSKGQLRLTSTHYVFKEDLSIVFAKNLRPQETKILVIDDNNNFVPVIVDEISNEWHDGYISFYTRAGSVIADGVLCSCYDHCPPSQALMDLVFLPVRWWSFIMPIIHREEHLHPYVKFLETTYLWFVNAMKKGKRLIGK